MRYVSFELGLRVSEVRLGFGIFAAVGFVFESVHVRVETVCEPMSA